MRKWIPLVLWLRSLAGAGIVVWSLRERPQYCWVMVRTQRGSDPAFSAGIHPFVDVEFPPGTPGDPPLKRRYPLDGSAWQHRRELLQSIGGLVRCAPETVLLDCRDWVVLGTRPIPGGISLCSAQLQPFVTGAWS